MKIVIIDYVLETHQEVLVSTKLHQVDDVEDKDNHARCRGNLEVPLEFVVCKVNLSEEQNQLEYEHCLINFADFTVNLVNDAITALMLGLHVLVRGACAVNKTIIDYNIDHHEGYLKNVNRQDTVVLNVDIAPLILQKSLNML